MKSVKGFFLPLVFSFFLSAAVVSLGTESKSFDPNETVAVSAVGQTKVIPGGKCIGVTLSMDGVVVVNLAGISSTESLHSPAQDAGIKPGDVIKFFNNREIFDVSDLTDAINESEGRISTVTLVRENKEIQTTISPQESPDDGRLKIGAWVKDAASGIGTITFYNPETKFFAALGHGINDPESEKLLTLDSGSILNATIVSVDKGEKGIPGELQGIFSEETPLLGTISENRDSGICGTVLDSFCLSHEAVPVASKEEIQTGSAYILANVEGNKVERFDIEILRILPLNNTESKNMVIKVTDERLIEKTGGIVQGMSGSPIIQNSKLVGAVTHVFVNDPTRGYGIFIENMLAEAEKVK